MRVHARLDDTTTLRSRFPSAASAATASSLRLTAGSNAGGRSRKETATSANTTVDGRPASHGRSSSAKRSGDWTNTNSGRPLANVDRAIDPTTIGHAARGSLAMLRRPAGSFSHRMSSGAAPSEDSQIAVKQAPRSQARRRGCTSPSPARAPTRGRARVSRRLLTRPSPGARPRPW